MATKRKSTKGGTMPAVHGRTLAALGRDVVLVQVKRSKAPTTRRVDTASVLVKKAGAALKRPGISKEGIFRGRQADRVFSYSVYPNDPRQIVRESKSGKRTVGRLVDGKFRASKAA